MKIDLGNEIFFEENEIIFDKRINFVFGKNGTGKSTITELIKEQALDYDIRIFQGFEGILGDNRRLNAVVLGEENSKINKHIEIKTENIKKLELEKNAILRMISEPDNDEKNLWTKDENAKTALTGKEEEIKKFQRNSASIIKRETDPQLSDPNYDIRNFSSEIDSAKLLQDIEISKYKEILRSDPKEAKTVQFPVNDFEIYLSDINTILQSKVKEKIRISRLENNEDRRKFAENGLKCHQNGDVCAFCGNKIDNDVFSELESYFSADEVKKLQGQIVNKMKMIEQELIKVGKIELETENFYTEFLDRAMSIEIKISELSEKHHDLLIQMKDVLQKKASNLFAESEMLDIKIPISFDEIESKYKVLVRDNNKNDLLQNQREAREKLRFHKIKVLLDEFEYNVKMKELSILKEEKEKTFSALNVEKNKIDGDSGIDKQISIIKEGNNELLAQTKDDKKLAQIINSKLKCFVSFELVHCEIAEGNGFYQVKCLRSNSIREITKLSTGEKNIIAFLYFIEKLNEINEVEKNQKKVIVFDDPMNSNDDTMQYMIIDELQKLIKQIENGDKLILLTHNNHFYLNVKYGRKYREDKFIRFLSNGYTTKFKYLKKEQEDFKTNYEALWTEIKFLFTEENSSTGMLLNPIRRIIETYTKFNGINKNKFYENQSGAKKLFDVNSHSIDDLEADLNGKTKEEIIRLMEKCFKDNNSVEHFNKHWGSIAPIN